MKKTKTNYMDGFLKLLASIVTRYPRSLIICSLVLCGCGLYYTANHLGMNTKTEDMLSLELPFQKNRLRFERNFPQSSSGLILVIDSPTPELTMAASERLSTLMEQEKTVIKSLYMPGGEEFFQRNGLLYLDLDELQNLDDKLAQAQPFIGALAQNYSLDGLFKLIGAILDDPGQDGFTAELGTMLDKIGEAVRQNLQDRHELLSWQEFMLGEEAAAKQRRRVILANLHLDYSQFTPAEKPLVAIRALARRVEADFTGTRIRFTGVIALEHEELASLSHSTLIASGVSLALVYLSLWFGLGSFRMACATLLVLVIGLIYTATFAALTVGHLNLISIAFAVLYIGLGVDYAVHLCLRYREYLQRCQNPRLAISDSLRAIGPSLMLCMITTAIGFFAFIPTDYKGVSELGIIAGCGMVIGLIVSLTVLAPLLVLILPKIDKPLGRILPSCWYDAPIKYARPIRWLSICAGLGACALLTQVSFDSNAVNLRNPRDESVITFKDLMRSQDYTPLTVTVLAQGKTQLEHSLAALKKIDVVDHAVSIEDFIPADQDEKLSIIDEMSTVVGVHKLRFERPPSEHPTVEAVDKLSAAIRRNLANHYHGIDPEIQQRLLDALQQLSSRIKQDPAMSRRLQDLESSLLRNLPITMERLNLSLQATAVDLKHLPASVTEQWYNKTSDIYRIEVFPRQDLNQADHLKQFVYAVQKLMPSATGLPMIDVASGDAVVFAFQQAFLSALAAIVVLLLLMLRNLRAAVLVLFPLLLASAYTGAMTVILDNPFNFANIIALPLLLGFGIDSGIHIVDRLRNRAGNEENPLRTSTARGVMFSALTTLFSFSSLAFTAHQGIASMGLLLTISLLCTLFCSLVVLPAFAELRMNPPKRSYRGFAKF